MLLATLSLYVCYSDIKSRTIGNRVCGVIAINCIALSVVNGNSAFITAPLIVLTFGIVLSNFKLLGGGDSKLLAAYLIAIEPSNIASILVIIGILGGILSLAYLIINKLTQKLKPGVPYGVAIAMGGFIGVAASL
ncbi:A24 family peptidase [Vibrio aquaticus]|uniref:A24 family peptidase n=1 Tax=Vibrio aquaticus TaxID=2496559 RepID=UPI00131A2B9E|nr:prepilin peptidase [Vibrio aquaticus]